MGGTKVRATFVGRASELERLGDALSRAIQGNGVAVLVEGEAGIGKTRLVSEFCKRALAGDAVVLTGECVESGAAGLPYGPIAQALHGAVASGLLDDTMLHAAVAEQLAILVPGIGRANAGETPPFALAGLGQVRLFEAILATVEHLSADRALVLVIEDVHWADRSTLDLLTFLVRNVESTSCMVVATVRTEDVTRGGPLASTLAELLRRPTVERMDLDRLELAETTAFLHAMLGDSLDEHLAARIHRRSDGNPFFVEHLALAQQEGEGGGDSALPPGLRDVLLNQLNRQPPDVQALLAAAAIAGPQADEPLLLAVLDGSEREVVVALRQAIHAHLLVPTRDQGGESYPFRHALMAEAVEADLLDSDRRRLRTRCADALSQRPPGGGVDRAQWAARIAHHRDRAGDAAGTVAASLLAAVEAEAVSAHRDAFVQYDRAIRILDASPGLGAPDGWDQSEIHVRAAACAAVVGEVKEAARLTGIALDRLPDSSDPLRRGALLTSHSEQLWLAGDDRFLDALRRAVEVIPIHPPTAQRADALISLGFHDKYTGQVDQARQSWSEGLRVAVLAGSARDEAVARTCLAQLALEDGELERAEVLRCEALAALHRATPDASTSVVYMDLTAVTAWSCHEDEAVTICREGIAAAQHHGYATYFGGGIVANGAEALWSLGRLREAAELLDTVEIGGAGGFSEVCSRIVRALVSTTLGDLDRASREVAASEAWTDAGDRSVGRLLGLVKAEVALESGCPAEVAAIAGIALGLPRSHTPWDDQRAALAWFQVRAAADMAEVARAQHDPDGVAAAREAGQLALTALHVELTKTRSELAPDRRRARAYAAMAAAESTRLEGRSDPEAWCTARGAWTGLNHVLRPMYAQVRQAEALLERNRSRRADAVALLVDIHRQAVDIGAARLSEMIEGLARRARVGLERIDPEVASAAPRNLRAQSAHQRPYGLTDREVEILGLLAVGLTNRQIGDRLYISPKTAGVHVSNILGKLDVGSRIQAATMAHHMGLTPIESAVAT